MIVGGAMDACAGGEPEYLFLFHSAVAEGGTLGGVAAQLRTPMFPSPPLCGWTPSSASQLRTLFVRVNIGHSAWMLHMGRRLACAGENIIKQTTIKLVDETTKCG